MIIKPHPSEKSEKYYKIAKKFKNIKVITKDVRPTLSWIYASEILISNNCTSSVEAFFLKKISLNLITYNNPDQDFFLPKKVSLNFFNIDKLLKFIEKFYNNKKNYENIIKTKKIDKILSNSYYNFLDKTCSATNIIEILKKKTKINVSGVDKRKNYIFFVYFIIKHIFRKIYQNIKSHLFEVEYKDKMKYFSKKMINFNKKNVEKILFRLSKINKYNNDKIVVEEIFPRIFLIDKK